MKIFKHQQWHALSLAVLLFIIYFLVKSDSTFLAGELFGISTWYWFLFALSSPILHQIYVLIGWRAELFYKSFSNRFGENGFKLFKIGFALLILSRPVTLILLAYSNADTLSINTTLSYILSVILFIPSAYLFYSVRKYFGMDRAFGIDHFEPDLFKNTPMVNQGIFKYTSNGMYVFGLLFLWIPGILLQSKAALLLGVFNHVYIWVHYYFTEEPNMKVIYSAEK